MKKTREVTCEDIEGKTYQVPSDKLTFRPAVYGVIIQDGKILLSKQWDGYDFPGGGIDLGEDTETALIREVKEETGVDVEVGRIVYSSNSFFKLPFKEKFVHYSNIELYKRYLSEKFGLPVI
jgi:8-oxo-dGTP diphosphatase